MKSILIVDDSSIARSAMCFALKIKNYTVIDSINGKDAVKKLGANQDIGLVITDLNMPAMNGGELVSYIRETMDNKTLPIYVLTTDESSGEEVLGKGATGFLLKSIKTSEEIQDIVRKHIGLAA